MFQWKDVNFWRPCISFLLALLGSSSSSTFCPLKHLFLHLGDSDSPISLLHQSVFGFLAYLISMQVSSSSWLLILLCVHLPFYSRGPHLHGHAHRPGGWDSCCGPFHDVMWITVAAVPPSDILLNLSLYPMDCAAPNSFAWVILNRSTDWLYQTSPAGVPPSAWSSHLIIQPIRACPTILLCRQLHSVCSSKLCWHFYFWFIIHLSCGFGTGRS